MALSGTLRGSVQPQQAPGDRCAPGAALRNNPLVDERAALQSVGTSGACVYEKEPQMRGQTKYSDEFAGNERNHDLPVKFDMTDGYLGITQKHDNVIDRVLLSPDQVKKLVAFAAVKTSH